LSDELSKDEARARAIALLDALAASEHGLTGARDWIVLSALAAGPRQTQLALAQSLGLDKTTMTSLLDRMESRGLITRAIDSHDRRARIPELTEAGGRVQAEVASARDRVEAGLLSGFTADELLTEIPLDTPAKVADRPPAEWTAARKASTESSSPRRKPPGRQRRQERDFSGPISPLLASLASWRFSSLSQERARR